MKEASPTFLEKLAAELLVAMGYGGSRQDAGRTVGRAGDGGIDDVIYEARLAGRYLCTGKNVGTAPSVVRKSKSLQVPPGTAREKVDLYNHVGLYERC